MKHTRLYMYKINKNNMYINYSMPSVSFHNLEVMNFYTRNIHYLTNDVYSDGINKNNGLFLLGTRI